ncbi:MAG: ATP phosphoribosyltransferase regulatory subunit [Methanosarcinales archaeon]|nr:ATP phosphoribosyltransferase regulatory subunit [Methanosarcinales archaeon]
MKLHRPRGTRDFTPAETRKRRYIENRMRAIAENWGYEEVKMYYFENCFRYERPQKGRFREFWQFGVELIGSDRTGAEGLLKEISD